jgi:hypothetical protein
MVYGAPLPGRIRFVSHAVREIRNRLPDAISGIKGSGTIQYKNRMDDIALNWRKAGFDPRGPAGDPAGGSESAASPGSDVSLPRPLFLKIQALVQDHEGARERPEEAALRLFEHCAPENRALRVTLRPVVLSWLEVTRWFQQKAHDSGMLDAELASEDSFRNQFGLFETTLGALVRGFFATIEGLDEILEDTNS